jgi:hypothetical protein
MIMVIAKFESAQKRVIFATKSDFLRIISVLPNCKYRPWKYIDKTRRGITSLLLSNSLPPNIVTIAGEDVKNIRQITPITAGYEVQYFPTICEEFSLCSHTSRNIGDQALSIPEVIMTKKAAIAYPKE